VKPRPVERLEVSLAFQAPRRVGRLAWIDGRVYFEYDPELLSSGVEISPFKLPLSAGVKEDERRTFDGLFGVFNDSLPDGWGRLLLDRELRRRGVDPGAPTPLERLAHIGGHGMGALTYQPTYEREAAPEVIDLHRLADQSRQILEGAPDQLAPELFRSMPTPTWPEPQASTWSRPPSSDERAASRATSRRVASIDVGRRASTSTAPAGCSTPITGRLRSTTTPCCARRDA